MPFCTIQEAWGNLDFEPFANPPKNNNNKPEEILIQEPEPEPVPVNEPERQPLLSNNETQLMINQIVQEKIALENNNNNNNNNNNQYNSDIDLINKKIDNILRRLEESHVVQEQPDFFNKNIHDIILFIIFGLFLILILDGMYKILLLKLKNNL
jgi:hypothetical protein